MTSDVPLLCKHFITSHIYYEFLHDFIFRTLYTQTAYYETQYRLQGHYV